MSRVEGMSQTPRGTGRVRSTSVDNNRDSAYAAGMYTQYVDVTNKHVRVSIYSSILSLLR